MHYPSANRLLGAMGARWVLLCLALLPLALAAAPSGEEQLTAFLDDLHSLRADFNQVVYAPGKGPASGTASGVLYLKRPDRFRWDYDHPAEQEIVADGISVWHYDPELEQVAVQFQSIALKGTPAELLTSEEPVEKFFELHDEGEREGLAWVRLIPREEEPQFQEIELGFEEGLLQAMRMVDGFDQTIWFLFENVEKNVELDDQLFRFDPPPGYDVFEH